MINLNRGISTTLAITIIIILAILVGGGIYVYQYYYLPKQETEISKVETPKDETANWEIYRNENGGYTMKYPLDLLIKHTVAEVGKTWPNFVDSIEINSENNLTNPANWRIEVWKNTDGLTAQQRAEQIGGVTPTQNKVITKIDINGIESRKVVIDYLPSDIDPENTIQNATSIFIVKGGNIYEFFCLNKITKESGTKDYDYIRFNQMISTFRFID